MRYDKSSLIEPPLNYTGSKYKYLEFLFPLFPEVESIDYYYEPFFGGGSVGYNVNYGERVVNEYITPLASIHQKMLKLDLDSFLAKVNKYKIEKSDKEGYHKLRDKFNKSKNNPYMLFCLMLSCTNNMARFNKSGGFNQTFGKRSINQKTIEKLEAFNKIYPDKPNNFKILSKDYSLFLDKIIELNRAPERSFIYLDPPYMITRAGYNVLWSKELEERLYEYLILLDTKGYKWAISNVYEHKGKVNEYIHKLDGYNHHEMGFNYNKVSRKGKSNSKEVLITNYG